MKLWSHMTTALAGLAALAVGLTAFGASAPIANSKHNMNVVFGPNTIQDNQICLPCHSPHARQEEGMEYLWNHEMPNTAYKLYKSTYTGLDEASKMCLSCHDGTVAVDSYFSTLGAQTAGETLHQGTHILGQGDDKNGNSTAGFVVGGGTGDLSHDHPVGVAYPGLSPTGVWDKATAGRFKDPGQFMTVTSRTGTTLSAVKQSAGYISADQTGAPAGGYNYTSYIKGVDANGVSIGSANPVGGGAITLEKVSSTDTVGTIIGCVACHTPHTSTYNFLRIPNTNSQLCLTCHDK
jgi:predicted CXXCH cytochrome family protein